MAYFANYDGKERPVTEIPKKTDANCVECGETMRVWNPDDAARHLKHIKNMRGSGGGGGGSDCSGGEGTQHQEWKVFAYDALVDAFDPETDPDAFDDDSKAALLKEKGVDAPASDKDYRVGDVVMTFAEPDPQLGDGLIVEVQDKHDDKDLFMTTQDYIEQGFSVVWLKEHHFGEDSCTLDEIDFRHMARGSTVKYGWPEVAPDRDEWRPLGRQQRRQDGADFVAAEGKADTVVEANIPADWALPSPAEYWDNTWWYRRFPDRDGTPAEHYRTEVAAGQTQPATTVEATLPHYWFTRDVWEQSDWASRFHDRTPNVPDDANAEIEAAYPAAWDWEPNVYHLSEKNAPRNCVNCGDRATAYVHGHGFYCGFCWDAPDSLAEGPSDRTGISPQTTTSTLD